MKKSLCVFLLTVFLLPTTAVGQRTSETARFAASVLDSLVSVATAKINAPGGGTGITYREYFGATAEMAQFIDSPDSQVRSAAENLWIFFNTAYVKSEHLDELTIDAANPPEPGVFDAAVADRDAWIARTPESVKAQVEHALLGSSGVSGQERREWLRISAKERTALLSRLSKVLAQDALGQTSSSRIRPEEKALREVSTLLTRQDLKSLDELVFVPELQD